MDQVSIPERKNQIKQAITLLEDFPLTNDQPNIQGPSISINYDGYSNPNFSDTNGFECRWTVEMQEIKKMQEILSQGEFFQSMLYTYRSCSSAVPRVKATDDPNKATIYEKTYEILEPEVGKLKKLMFFQKESIAFFKQITDNVKNGLAKKLVYSEEFVLHMIKMLDMFAKLDALKDMKACLNNDFSFFKRAFGFLRKNMGNDDQTQENHTLYLFLANNNSITTSLKSELQGLSGFDDTLSLVANMCADYMEQELFVLPDEKFMLLRVMPFLLSLMDGPDKLNIFKSKKIKISRFTKIFDKYPVVPLYGDMQITLSLILKNSPNFDEKLIGPLEVDPKGAVNYELNQIIGRIRLEHHTYVTDLSLLVNELHIYKKLNKETGLGTAQRVYETVLRGIKYLGAWTAAVMMQSAWKYARPNKAEDLQDYERVVKKNYTPEECWTLVEVIGFIKGLSGLLIKNESLFAPHLKLTIHDEIQNFVQSDITPALRYISKQKKKTTDLREDLLNLRTIGADWIGGTEPPDESLFGGKKKTTKTKEEKITWNPRKVGPSPTQLVLIRNSVYGYIAHKILGPKKGLYSDKNFNGETKVFENFYKRSFNYKYILDFNNSIIQCSDLGDLWYREFYLEISKKLQFPIEMSLPWILTDSIIEPHHTAMYDYALYPFELYNDAAERALNSLKQQFLYDEIEAEVNLAFDQFIYKLSEQVYTYYKTRAASILLDKDYKKDLQFISEHQEQPQNQFRYKPSKSRFGTLLRQRNFQLLGRSIDLNTLIAQRMNNQLRKNIDIAISHFEANDITSIVGLHNLIKCTRKTYELLSRDFTLDPWESIYHEKDGTIALNSCQGRIANHVLFELAYDFFPNFNFNMLTQRFVRTSEPYAPEPPRDNEINMKKYSMLFGTRGFTQAFFKIEELYKKFFGIQHFEAIIELLGDEYLPLIIGETVNNLDAKIRNVLSPYTEALNRALPPTLKLPRLDYGIVGAFGYYELNLKDITEYDQLNPVVNQHFKETGNTVIFFLLLEKARSFETSKRLIVTAPFLGMTSENYNDPGERTSKSPFFSSINTLCSALNNQREKGVAKVPEILSDLITSAQKADLYYRPPSSDNFSIFKSALRGIQNCLSSVWSNWQGVLSENGVLAIEKTTAFYRLWSTLQYVWCLPNKQKENQKEGEALFGHGWAWGGCTLIYFLKQRPQFEVFDFSYHVLKIMEINEHELNTVEPKKKKEGEYDPNAKKQYELADLREFRQKAREIKRINDAIFSTLESYVPLGDSKPEPFSPPTEPGWDEASFIQVAKEGAPQNFDRMSTLNSFSMSESTSKSVGYDNNFPPPPPNNNFPTPPPNNFPPPPPNNNFPTPPPNNFPPPPPGNFPPPPPGNDFPPPPGNNFPPPPPPPPGF
eukprot:TRINITY_DN766_c0_g1_i1.p1 TRINITY_DN766_c0_g1~~TRINITY_DN766_c0_g1_i1.p1  ORF type:complete len:1390 (-),score=504.69 TRINITY_DN766_c0_g1_i1:45-4214(-)